jgi:hypothetical protein
MGYMGLTIGHMSNIPRMVKTVDQLQKEAGVLGGQLFPSNHSEALGPPWGCCWQLVRGSSRFGHTSDWFGLALIDLVE